MTPAEIRDIRRVLRMTQAEMAARLGINIRSYQRYEAEPGSAESNVPGGSALIILRGMQAQADERRARASK